MDQSLNENAGKLDRLFQKYDNLWNSSSKRKKVLIYLGIYTTVFLITFLISYSPFLQNGKSFIRLGDPRNQHFPTLIYIGRTLRAFILELFKGNFVLPQFDLTLCLGGDIASILFCHNIADPLNWLAIFFPTKHIESLYNFLSIFRIYLSGLSFSALCFYHKKQVSHILIGALVYIYSGYAICNAIQHMILVNELIQFPLLLIGADQILKKKKPFLFILSVFYSALCGYYLLYMMTLALGAYILVRFLELYTLNRIKEFLKMAIRIIWTYALGIGLSAAILLPAVFGYLACSRSNGTSQKRNLLFYNFEYYKDNLTKLIAPPGSWDSLSLAAIVLLGIVVILSLKKYRVLKQLFVVGSIFYIMPLGGYIMNGGQYVSSRWIFILVLLFSYILVESLPELLNANRRQKLINIIILTAYTSWVFTIGKKNIYYMVGVAMLAITVSVLYLCSENTINSIKINRGRINNLICLLLVAFNVCVNALYYFDLQIKNYSEYGIETELIETAIERSAEPFLGKKDGRFDSSQFARLLGMVWRVPNMGSYWSITNRNVVDFWNKLENNGQRAHNFAINGADQRLLATTLLSTKYYIERENRTQYVPYGYSLIEKDETGHLIYKNQYALPWGYTYDTFIPYEKLDNMNGLEIEEALMQNIALDINPLVGMEGTVTSNIKKIPYNIIEMRDISWDKGILKVEKNNGSMEIGFEMPKEVYGYLRLHGLNINGSEETNFIISVKCKKVHKTAAASSEDYEWHYGRENYLFNLGYSADDRTSCVITFPVKGTFKLDDIELYALPMNNYINQVESLRAEPLENIQWETNKISGVVNLSKGKILCMSIPYSKGWSAKVDGKEVKILRGNYMFMALPLTAGHHEIEFSYCSPGLKIGIIVSIFSIVILLLFILHDRKLKNK